MFTQILIWISKIYPISLRATVHSNIVVCAVMQTLLPWFLISIRSLNKIAKQNVQAGKDIAL